MKVLKWLGVGVVYYLLARISFLTVLPGAPAGPAPTWLPTGFAVAMILIYGYGIWPGILLGSILNSSPEGIGWSGVTGFLLANTIDPLLAAWLPRRILKRDVDFNRPRDLAVFILTTICCSSAFSATVGSSTIVLIKGQLIVNHGITWLIWWVSDFLSVLLLTPLLIAWWNRSAPSRTPWREILLGTLLGSGLLLFIFSMPLGRDTLHFVYLFIPFVIWLGFRLELRRTMTILFLFSMAVILATSQGIGPFIGATPHLSFLYVQSFLTVNSVLGLLLVAAVSERERAVQMRDEFFLLASQELKTPLAVLGMQSRFMKELTEKEELEKLSMAQRKEMIEIYFKETQRLGDLVDDLLEGARIVAGKVDLAAGEMDLRELVAAVMLDHAGGIREAGVEVRVTGGAARGVWDRKKLQFVVRTLLRNALKYGAGKPVEVATAVRGDRALLTVEDHGIGIAKEQQEKIFERFERRADVKVYGGIGQGLFISKGLLEAHGGRILVESVPDQGTKFTVELPVRSN